MKNLVTTLVFSLLVSAGAFAEDVNAVFKRVNELVAAKNYPKALEELGRAREDIEKLHLARLQGYLPDAVVGYAASPPASQSALGILSVERVYTKGASILKLAIRAGTIGGGQGSFGSIAQLGRMAALMGSQSGRAAIQIGGRPAVFKDRGGKNDLMIFLESGTIVTVEGGAASTNDEMRGFAEALNLSELDRYLSAQ